MTGEELWKSVEEKHLAMKERVRARLAQERVDSNSIRGFQIEAEEVGNVMETMTPEERREYRQASELGCLPGDTGGGWDVLYVPDDGKDH